jgi:hypothetical protein
MTRSYEPSCLDRRVGGVADRDAIPHLRRRQLQAHLVVVDAVGLDADLVQQVHQRAGPQPRSMTRVGWNTSLMSCGFFASMRRRVSSE